MENFELDPQGRSTATIQLRVPEVSTLHGIVQSEPIHIRNLEWRLRVKPLLNANREKHALGVFLYCEGLRDSKTWSCKASAVFRLIPQKPGLVTYREEMTAKFHSDAMDWGYSKFYEWIPLAGYINAEGDFLDLEVDVSAEHPNYQDLEVLQREKTSKKGRLEAEVGAETFKGILKWKTEASNLVLLGSNDNDWYSLPTFIRGLKWQMLVQTETGDNSVFNKSVGIYLQCRPDGHLDQAQWNCTAKIYFMAKARQGSPSRCRKMTHVFRSGSVNQIGISNFISVESLLQRSNRYLKRYNIEFEVGVEAEVPIITTRTNIVAPIVEERVTVQFQRDSLICRYCCEIPRAEIYQCLNGHTICNVCILKCDAPKGCPTCQIPFEVERQLIRNRALESLILDVPFPS